MDDQIFTSQFWHDQWAVVTSAPWLIIPSLLIAGFVGWKWKGANDDGEIRGLQAEVKGVQAALNAVAERSDFVREKYEAADEKYKAVVNRENELKDKVARMTAEIEKLAKVAPIGVSDFVISTRDIKNTLTDLSTSTTSLGQALTALQEASYPTLHTPSAGLPFEQKGDVDLTKRKDKSRS